jgi:hypothetical protein
VLQLKGQEAMAGLLGTLGMVGLGVTKTLAEVLGSILSDILLFLMLLLVLD